MQKGFELLQYRNENMVDTFVSNAESRQWKQTWKMQSGKK